MKHRLLFSSLFLTLPFNSYASDFQDDLAWGSGEVMSIATGDITPIATSPVVGDVITRNDIESIDARNLDDILAMATGVYPQFRFEGTHYIIRGIRSRFSSEARILVDGVPYNDATFGNQRNFLADIPVDLIERVEVIRGPISSLHGVDAFSGAINIVTRAPSDIEHNELSLRFGSYNEFYGHYLHGFSGKSFDATLSLYGTETEGHEPFIQSDAQSQIDLLLGTNASLAPSNAFTDRERYRIGLDVEFDHTRLKLGYRGHLYQTGAGLTGALDPSGQSDSRQWNIDLLHEIDHWLPEAWNGDVRASIIDYDTRSRELNIFPPGAFGFPDGVFAEPGFVEQITSVDVSATRASRAGSFTMAVGFEDNNVTDVSDRRNFQFVIPAPGLGPIPVPVGGRFPVTGDDRWLIETSRTNVYGLGQIVHTLSPGLELTAGLRYDRHSDVKNVFSPRAALVWAAKPNATYKFMAGRGFRAPAFLALYGNQTPALSGNPELKPVSIFSYDIAGEWRFPEQNLTTRLNVFYHEIDDAIVTVNRVLNDILANAGNTRAWGLEGELVWQSSDARWMSKFNASIHDSENIDTGETLPVSPRSTAMALVRYNVNSDQYFTLQTQFVGRATSPSPSIRAGASHLLTNITWRHDNLFLEGLDLSVSVKNLFDREAFTTGSGSVQDGVPLPDRNAYLSLRYRF
jgi:iron complex outermembrane receptor protein